MPTTILSAGGTYTIAQTTSYALPPVAVWVQSSNALQVSLDNSTFTDVTATTTGTVLVAPFVRCSAAATIVTVKRV